MKKQVVALCLGCLCLAVMGTLPTIAADQVAVGAEYTAVLRSDGTVWGVGRNHYGQLGDGTTNQRLRLVQALLPVKAAALCAGDNHTLALDESGQVWSWGYNGSGQLGLGNSQPTNRPTLIPNLIDVIAIGAGGNYSFAVHRDGSLYVWGQNNQGQLGLGITSSSTNRPTRVEIPGFQIIQADGGTMHTLILATNATQESRLYTCGMNNDGQLGLGYTGGYSNQFTWISNLSGVRGVCAGGNSSMVLLSNGTVFVWGNNINGQMGLGSSDSTSTPTRLPAFSNVVGLACSPNHILLNMNNGSIYGCGVNDSAQLGVDYFLNIYSPLKMTEPSNVVFTSIGAGNNHSAALDDQGALWTWGLNNFGQLGDGFTTLARQPTPALTSGEALSIACGLHHVLALESPDRLSSWGENPYGQLGNGTTASQSQPEQIAAGYGRVICGQNHALAISNGQLYAWGRSSSGQLGLGYVGDQILPTHVDLPMPIAEVAAGDTFSFAILTNGQLMSWGDNNSGQLGVGHTQRAYYPTNVGLVDQPMMEVAQVAGGGAHALAVKTNGSAWAWGYNTFGQLGKGNTVNTNLPIAILPGILTNVIKVAAGGYHSLFLQNGEVWSCGYNGLGQLGLVGASTSTPTRIVQLTNVTAIACGGYHSLALLADHSVWAWGDNNYGQLGNSVKGNTNLPTQVSLLTNVVAIAAHDNVSAAIENNRIYVWGTDEYGQIGNNHRRWTPFNADTLFAGIAPSEGDYRLRWNTGKQVVYQVFCITNLMSENWLSLGWVTSSAYAVDFPVTNGLPGFFAVQQQ